MKKAIVPKRPVGLNGYGRTILADKTNWEARCTLCNSTRLLSNKLQDIQHRRDLNDLPVANSLQDIPGPRGIYDVPIIGNVLQFYPFTNFSKNNINMLFRDLHRRYGKIVRWRTGITTSVFLFDPDYISKVMMNEGQYPERFTIPILETYAKRNKKLLFSLLNGQEWYSIRGPVQQRIKLSSIAGYVQAQENCANDLVTWINFHGNNNPKIKDAFFRYVTDANAVLTFNKKIGFLHGMNNPENEHFLSCIDTVFQIVASSVYSIPWFKVLPTKEYRQFEKAMNELLRMCEKYITEAKTKQHKTDMEQENILDSLLADPKMPLHYIVTMMSAMLFAGVETTTQRLVWTFWILAKHEKIQDALYDEIKSTVGEEPLSTSRLRHMPYLKACVKEAFRFVFPNPNGTVRILDNDIEIGGYIIPKNTHIHFGNNALCMSDEYFDDPEKFLPDRWLPGINTNEKQRLMALCVLPFGLGKRNCLGRRFAEQEIYIVIVQVLKRFRISVADDSMDITPSYRTAIATPHKPIKLVFIPR